MQPHLDVRHAFPIKKPLHAFHQAAYFLLIGWWLGGLWLLLGYVLCLTIILLPLGIAMLWNAPFLLFLRFPALSLQLQQRVRITPEEVRIVVGTPTPPPFFVRVLWFLALGWWCGGLCCLVGYILCILLFPRQGGIWLLEHIPSIMVLQTMSVQFEF